jgi:CHASE2 domain-containing sensor protein
MNIASVKKTVALYGGLALVVLATLSFSYFRLFDNYELETLDIRYQLRPILPIDKNIVIIEIADDTVNKLGTWPISRRYHALLVDALTEADAQLIFFDVFFSETSNEEADGQFEEAIRKSGKVYLPYVFDITERSERDVPHAGGFQEDILQRFQRHARGTGFINIVPDPDGKFRRVPPLIKYRDALYPHICLSLYVDYLGLEEEAIDVIPGRRLSVGERLRIPLDIHSMMIIDFPGKWEKTFRHYSYIDIIDSYLCTKFPDAMGREPIVDLSELDGSVCFVAVTATATPDAHPSPFDVMYPGVGVNASLFNSLLQVRFIQRVTRPVSLLILMVLSAITCFISLRTRTSHAVLYVFLFILGYVIASYALFLGWGLWINVFYPVTVILFLFLGTTFVKYINETHKREILEKELGIAKKIQESFLPKEKPKVAGVDIATKMVTARQVGGDLYDFVERPDDVFGVMIGDVSGKGVPAALYMAKVVSEFTSYIGEASTADTISKLNDQLCNESGSGLFVTLSYAIFDMKEKSVRYSTGGHLPMIMARKGEAEPRLIDLKEGMPLGLFEGTFCEEKISFQSGDMFILYTDGVTEAMNPKDEMFGQEKLVDLVKQNINAEAQTLVDVIQDAVKKYEKGKQHDDITAMCVRII